LLNTDEEPLILLAPASTGKRFINYLVDIILFSFLLLFILIAIAPVYPLFNKIMERQVLDLADRFAITFIYALYMSVMESVLKGKSVGKYITGTRAVDINGLPVSHQTAFTRGLIRMVPFEQISAISFDFSPPLMWHDRWSKSIVVDEAKSRLAPPK
jgi:uncharacterized RDD family membrane protein YckC